MDNLILNKHFKPSIETGIPNLEERIFSYFFIINPEFIIGGRMNKYDKKHTPAIIIGVPNNQKICFIFKFIMLYYHKFIFLILI